MPKVKTIFWLISFFSWQDRNASVTGWLYMFLSIIIYIYIYLYFYVSSLASDLVFTVITRAVCNCLIKKVNHGTDVFTHKHLLLALYVFSSTYVKSVQSAVTTCSVPLKSFSPNVIMSLSSLNCILMTRFLKQNFA